MGLSKNAGMQQTGWIFMVKMLEQRFLNFGVLGFSHVSQPFPDLQVFPRFPHIFRYQTHLLDFFQLLEAKKSTGIATWPGGQCHLEAKDLFVRGQLGLHRP
jgi:hypothetical protein